MEVRARVAADTAAVVPFHCIICFEEFSLQDRYPVILPCGHTYVCHPCSKRLKKCMECRESLFMPAAKFGATCPITRAPPAPSLYNRGGRYSPSPQTPPQSQFSPGQAIPLPIPKNLVLIAMMEAAERQAKVDPETIDKVEENSIIVQEDEDDEEAYDLNQIIGGLATLSGPCGTYAVKEEDGLAVLPNDPRRHRYESEEKKVELEDNVRDVVEREPFILEKGQTVQIVDFYDGVAKLSRGEGFIVATSSQLVKVSGPKEQACRLEGLLDTVISRGLDLQRELDENRKLETRLRLQLEAAQKCEPDHPVITEPPVSDSLSLTDSKDQAEFGADPVTPTSATKRGDEISQPFLRTPDYDSTGREFFISSRPSDLDAEGELKVHAPHSRYPPSPNSIDNSDINRGGLPNYRRHSEDDLENFGFGCGSAFLSTADIFGSAVSSSENNILSSMSLEPDERLRSNSAEGNYYTYHNGWQTAPTLTNSFDGVDFRTGMSGHRALGRSKPRSPTPRAQIRMMSEHRGVARVRGPSRSYDYSASPRFDNF